MTNQNVQILSDDEYRYQVRLMADSAKGGVISENRAEQFLVLNVNEIINGVPTGCGTIVFQGDLPTPDELRNCDLDIIGTWGVHAVYGGRFDVLAWGPVERPKAPPPKPKGKTRRIGAAPEPAPAKPRTRRLPPKAANSARTAKASKSDVELTNDWYAQSNGQGDSLDFLDKVS
ncbi:hypothetical protein [uncultured Paraglaciecola sp.]|uniref:hypothetical protein n=1 Tax=uncultured Paraglaciecola sp. TaxID=1765024 RepID=UPI002616203E|nr:hypothetical protein [uncultured Paraglaciecola sp.]